MRYMVRLPLYGTVLLCVILACRKSSRDIHAFNHQIATFSTAEKVTDARCGTSSPPAHFDRFQNAISVAKIAAQSRMISPAAALGFCKPKSLRRHVYHGVIRTHVTQNPMQSVAAIRKMVHSEAPRCHRASSTGKRRNHRTA